MADKARLQPVVLENSRIIFRNFSGIEGQYNREGDRNFAVILDEEVAQGLAADGWNVAYLKPREEGEQPQAILKVKVSYKSNQRPPRVVLITSRGRTNLDESTVNMLDWAEITNVDLIVNPYSWDVRGETGVAAYLKSIFVTINEDELERKYADVPDSALSGLVGPTFEGDDDDD